MREAHGIVGRGRVVSKLACHAKAFLWAPTLLRRASFLCVAALAHRRSLAARLQLIAPSLPKAASEKMIDRRPQMEACTDQREISGGSAAAAAASAMAFSATLLRVRHDRCFMTREGMLLGFIAWHLHLGYHDWPQHPEEATQEGCIARTRSATSAVQSVADV